ANSATIQIYARVRPPRKTAGANSLPRAAPSRSPHPPEPEPFSSRYTIFPPSNPGSDDPKDPSRFPHLHFDVPKDADAGIVNNTKDSFDFRFDAVFDRDASQEEVFDVVAKPVVQSVLEGYNGTVFAYGQTGSGKTFTITGGATRYADRGIIPRSLQHVFAEVARHPESEFDVHIAYLEIYNEQGYDLLGENIADAAVESLARETRRLEDLPKVSLHPDPSDPSSFQLRNLAWHAAPTLPSALNLLFLGDTNRMIAETPMNPSSSRSHCVFMVQVVRRQTGGGTGTVRRGKLCLVDLAGSERISRTSLAGSTLLREARSINLSLHHLEQCIVALHEKSLGRRDHVPYRNSVLTCMLKDSLGGNCRTVMVATVVGE
ncbi:kinesin-domain-containing protein, partial [Gonapodya prolifera JEL478]